MDFVNVSLAYMRRFARLDFEKFSGKLSYLVFGILITKAIAFAPEGFDCREKSIKLKGAGWGRVVFVQKIVEGKNLL